MKTVFERTRKRGYSGTMLPLDQHTHGPLVDKDKRGWSTWCPQCDTEYFAVTSKALIAEFTRVHLGDEWAEYELEMVADD